MLEFTQEELRSEFETAAREAISESNIDTRDEVRELVDKRLAAKEDDDGEDVISPAAPEDSDDDGENPNRNLLDRLEDEGVPQDLIDACAEYLAKAGVEKALDAAYVDPYLADSLDKNEDRYADQIDRHERALEAAAAVSITMGNETYQGDESTSGTTRTASAGRGKIAATSRE